MTGDEPPNSCFKDLALPFSIGVQQVRCGVILCHTESWPSQLFIANLFTLFFIERRRFFFLIRSDTLIWGVLVVLIKLYCLQKKVSGIRVPRRIPAFAAAVSRCQRNFPLYKWRLATSKSLITQHIMALKDLTATKTVAMQKLAFRQNAKTSFTNMHTVSLRMVARHVA